MPYIFGQKKQLDPEVCRDLTNKEMKGICKAKGIGGYSGLNKEGLIKKCCVAKNFPIEERLNWIPNKGKYESEDSEDLNLYIDRKENPIGLSGKKDEIEKCQFGDIVDVHYSMDIWINQENDWKRFNYFLHPSGEKKKEIHQNLYFVKDFYGERDKTFENKFYIKTPIGDCDDYYEQNITETAYKSLVKPSIRYGLSADGSIRCGFPLIVEGWERYNDYKEGISPDKMILVAPKIMDDYDIIYKIDRNTYYDMKQQYTTKELREKIYDLIRNNKDLENLKYIDLKSTDSMDDLIQKYISIRQRMHNKEN